MARSTNPFRELEELFERMQANVEEASQWWDTEPFEATSTGTGSVRVDLEDRDDRLVLTAELPGFDPENIDVSVTDRTLHLAAEREEETEEEAEGEYVRRERHRASLSRSVRLPQAVETDDISATYNNGVLTVELPKTEPLTEGVEIEVE